MSLLKGQNIAWFYCPGTLKGQPKIRLRVNFSDKGQNCSPVGQLADLTSQFVSTIAQTKWTALIWPWNDLEDLSLDLTHWSVYFNLKLRCFVGCLEFLRRQPLHTYKCHTALTRSIIFPTSCNLSSPYSWLLTSFLCIWIKYFRLAVLSFSLKKLLTSLSSSFNLSARKKVHLNSFAVKISSSFFSRDINCYDQAYYWHRLFIICCTCNQLD